MSTATFPAAPSPGTSAVDAARRVTRGGLDSWVGGAVLVAGAVVLALLPFDYLMGPAGAFRFVELFIYITLAVMWNLLAGFGGMVSIGQQAYIGLGAYGLIVLADEVGVDAFVAVPLAGVVAAVIAIPVSFLAFRLVGGYFAIGTWVIAEVVRLLTIQSDAVGAGSGTSLLALRGADAGLRLAFTYWWALGVAVLAVSVSVLLVRSPLGIGLTAIRDEPTAAAGLGINVTRIKRVVFVVAAAGCGMAGALLALSDLRVQPTSVYGIQWTAFMIFMVVIGGIGTLEGPIVGAVVFFVLQETLADYGETYLIVLGVVAVAVVLLAPRGLWGLVGGRGRIQVFPIRYRVLGPAPGRAMPAAPDPGGASHGSKATP
jgi:branched-chain amino acid transport system permease protein